MAAPQTCGIPDFAALAPCRYAHEVTGVARMSEAISGTFIVVFPHIAALMRATGWQRNERPASLSHHGVQQRLGKPPAAYCLRRSDAGRIHCKTNRLLSEPARHPQPHPDHRPLLRRRDGG